MDSQHAGGCLCGALRFAAAGDPAGVAYCHCRLCQRSSGAPVLVWVTFCESNFRYTRGAPAQFASSSHGLREFCSICGTQVLFRTTREPDIVDLNVGAMDDPARYVPQMHIHCESAIPWLRLGDALPRYDGPGPAEEII